MLHIITKLSQVFLTITFINPTISMFVETSSSKVYKDPYFIGGRSGIVHLFEWKFSDIASECEEFLGKYGYGGIQVSPVNENLIVEERPWYERYQPMSYKIITRSGNETGFRDMVHKCNKAGVRVFVDVVINHMTGTSTHAIGTGGSAANPSSKFYPAAGYSKVDFHRTCAIEDYQNATQVRNCELVGLHDLDHSKPNVQRRIVNYINRLIDIGVAGIRVDASKHMWPNQIKFIYRKLHNLNTNYFPAGSRPFVYQEVIDLGGEAVHATEYTGFGRVTDFKFGRELGRVFGGNGSLSTLRNFGSDWGMLPSGDSVVFIDNHDNQRGSGGGSDHILTYQQPKAYKMAIAFMLAWPETQPRIMSSYFFDDTNQGPPHYEDYSIKDVVINRDLTCGNGWVCEHRWSQIYSMINFHQVVRGSKIKHWWDNGSNQITFCRGTKGFIALNGDTYPLDQRLQTCLSAGYYCDIISGGKDFMSCAGKMLIVDKYGFSNIYIWPNETDGVLAIDETSKLWGP